MLYNCCSSQKTISSDLKESFQLYVRMCFVKLSCPFGRLWWNEVHVSFPRNKITPVCPLPPSWSSWWWFAAVVYLLNVFAVAVSSASALMSIDLHVKSQQRLGQTQRTPICLPSDSSSLDMPMNCCLHSSYTSRHSQNQPLVFLPCQSDLSCVKT